MSKKTSEPANSEYYSKLIIYKTRKKALLILNVGCFVFLMTAIYNFNLRDVSWTAMLPLVAGLSPLWIFFPATEIWHYCPWQSKAVQYEKHFKSK